MPTYILMASLSPQGLQTLKVTPERLLEVNRELDSFGVKVIRQWALLGFYDFMTICEAPDALTVARATAEISARGSASFDTLTAIDPEDVLPGL